MALIDSQEERAKLKERTAAYEKDGASQRIMRQSEMINI